MTRSATAEAGHRSARQRLLEAANELFYAEGVQTVGIDRIIERAGVAKASLYNTFGSKEALVQAYLDARREGTTGRLAAAAAAVDDPRGKVLAVFDAQARQFAQPGFRGCAFAAAAAEAPPDGTIEHATGDFRRWVRTLFVDLAKQAGARNPRELGAQLQMVYDGASLAARTDHTPGVARAAKRAAAALVDAAVRDAR